MGYKCISKETAKKAVYDLRKQAVDVPEMSLDEINTEIDAVRKERKIKVKAKEERYRCKFKQNRL